ncbi:hypothetical protein BOTBODRAFT_174481 [Botryobasidium botryosum FD-172 SS1]|uniref:DRBM domain-containing protein n=1 Tax=Botryobasidium botryosum (strain FD-172 SS1) TaxID=930990 RepID=A0A067MIP5_BOTB1|nr:hypothetical protein BOTBODRAFT_174481 [Botryobasidium botryosum FD-172 SS1]
MALNDFLQKRGWKKYLFENIYSIGPPNSLTWVAEYSLPINGYTFTGQAAAPTKGAAQDKAASQVLDHLNGGPTYPGSIPSW